MPRSMPTSRETANTEACWGNAKVASGWVNHPVQPVAAALVALRAYNRALGLRTVSPDGRPGLDIELNYPFLLDASEFAMSQGLPNYREAPERLTYRGSRCFQEGDPGPWWYTTGAKGGYQAEFARKEPTRLGRGNQARGSELHPGYFVFTVWVDTACTRPRSPSAPCDWKPEY